ncbi:hypothetical protein N7535_004101 [Penicillium sp. DV-2018c]|nr:hypothetical protein N7461_000193 [Penicillium sp. DV-2018c]KAJ5577175.1 hypothetical protein N7535_004101 [Penicillium sp. DV-2018c]
MADGLNQARAMRIAEIINDYRTLLLHISQQQVEPSQSDYWDEGFVVLRECLSSAQTLMSANYQPCPVTEQGNVETEKAELQRLIIDSSARRFQAHKIYLRAAAARRWTMTRASAPKDANAALYEDLARITDSYVHADLRAADLRAGHWVEDDPSLEVIQAWIAGC